jgi:ribokinase
MSARGSYLVQTGEAGGYIPALAVDAIDTTAAGDAFNGGFATALMRGATPVESARYASAVAAISVTRAGAQTAMPTAEEVDEFLEGVTVDLNHREDALRRI